MACAICGWTHVGNVDRCRVTVPTEPDAAAMATARLRHDLAAAVRASAGPTSIPPVAAGFCRGWHDLLPAGRAAYLRAARVEVEQDLRGAGDGEPIEAIRSGISRLVSGTVGRLGLVGVTVDGVRCCVVAVNERGEPVVTPHPELLDVWTDLLPEGATGARRRYLLAGGGEDGNAPGSRDAVAEQADVVLHAIAADDPDSEYLLLRGDAGFRMVDVLATGLRCRVLPVADLPAEAAADPVAFARTWAAAAPLRRRYELVCAEGDGRGAVRPVLVPLFRAGVEPARGTSPRSTLRLAAADGAPGTVEIRLPVVTGTGPADRDARSVPRQVPVVAVGAVTVEGTAPVRFELAAPGRVLVEGAPSASSPRLWGDLADRLPAHRGYDVAVAVEMCGPNNVVDERLRVLRDLVAAMSAREQSMRGVIRMAALGYRDHLEGIEVVTSTGFLQPRELAERVLPWSPAKVETVWGTALEDALTFAAGLSWRADRFRSLVVIGGRPPAVSVATRYYVTLCPHGIDWRTPVGVLRRKGVRIVAVDNEHEWPPQPGLPTPLVRELWTELGRDGHFRLPDLRITDLVGMVAPGSHAPIRLSRSIEGDSSHV